MTDDLTRAIDALTALQWMTGGTLLQHIVILRSELEDHRAAMMHRLEQVGVSPERDDTPEHLEDHD